MSAVILDFSSILLIEAGKRIIRWSLSFTSAAGISLLVRSMRWGVETRHRGGRNL